jgi:flagellar assembly protein FliH
MTHAFRKFRFETSFDERDSSLEKDVGPPPEPTFTVAELEAARIAAFAEGRQTGDGEARASIECLAGEAAARAQVCLDQLHQDLVAFKEGLTRQTLELAMEIVRRLMPGLAEREALGEIEAVIRTCLITHASEPRIVVRVADPLLDNVRERLDAMSQQTGFAGKIILLADDGVAPGDCRVEWADGGAERDLARLNRDVDAALAQILATQPEPAGTEPPVLPAE